MIPSGVANATKIS
jgi:hypothetical protein